MKVSCPIGATPEFAVQLDSLVVAPSRDTPTRRAALERRVVHIADVLADAEYLPSPAHRREKSQRRLRGFLAIPRKN